MTGSKVKINFPDRPFCLERPPSLKLILKVGGGNSSTPEYGSSESPVYGVQPENLGLLMDYPERHKKSKKKKKKKDREKKHKHHKEKRRNRDDSNDRGEANENSGRNECDESSQEDFSVNDDSSQYHAKFHSAMDSQSPASVSSVRPPLLSLKSPDLEPFTPPSVPLTSEPSPGMSSVRSESMKSPSSMSDASGREPRTCVLKLKQSKSPLAKLLNHLLKLLEKKDPHHFFAWPVTDEIAPGYSSIISRPMDFHTIRQKVEDSQYNSVQEFCDDFRLMCENAVKYNHVDTVYHKAAKKLLQVGAKMLQPDHLMRTFQAYMQDLGQMELGFDMTQNAHDDEMHGVDSADEGMSTGAEEVNLAQLEEDEKRRNIRYDFVENFLVLKLTNRLFQIGERAEEPLRAVRRRFDARRNTRPSAECRREGQAHVRPEASDQNGLLAAAQGRNHEHGNPGRRRQLLPGASGLAGRLHWQAAARHREAARVQERSTQQCEGGEAAELRDLLLLRAHL